MEYHHRWLLKGRIAHFLLSEPPGNPQEAQAINRAFTQYLDAGTEKGVHLLVDVREEGDLMPDMKSMMQAAFVRHEKIVSLILICHPYQVQRIVGDVISRKGRIKHLQVNSFADAIEQLNRIDPNLPKLSQISETIPEFTPGEYPTHTG